MNKKIAELLRCIEVSIDIQQKKIHILKSLKILPPKYVHIKLNIYTLSYLRDNKKMIRSSTIIKEVLFWLREREQSSYFMSIFSEWVELYKVGAIRDISLQKYYIAEQRLAGWHLV